MATRSSKRLGRPIISRSEARLGSMGCVKGPEGKMVWCAGTSSQGTNQAVIELEGGAAEFWGSQHAQRARLPGSANTFAIL